MKFNLKYFLTNTGLTLCAALVFALSFPNFIFKWGFWPLSFIALLPLGILVRRISFKTSFIYGLFYGLISYGLFNFWLAKFHPLAIVIVPVIYSFYLMLVLPCLKLLDLYLPKYGFIAQTIVWIGYEYLSTLGFVGYSYGILGYAFYSVPLIAGMASYGGVWIVSFLASFSGFLGAAILNNKNFYKKYLIGLGSAVVFFVLISAISLYDYSSDQTQRLAVIQHNMDPWVGGDEAYEEGLERLITLSNEALNENPDMIAWSETAFIPGIEWHKEQRTSPFRYRLVRELETFVKKLPVPLVLGNGRGVLNDNGKRINFNSVYLVESKDNEVVYLDRYDKVHLVPFTEHFPYKDYLPMIYQWLKNADTHFWEKGDKFTVMEYNNVKFSTPICFEDTFGYISRAMVQNGADYILNLTNDTWSKSEVAMIQHHGMAVFRAIENRRSVVRSTNGGFTSFIDPNGFVLASAPVFEETYIVGSIPLVKNVDTLYNIWGDWFGILALILGIISLVYAVVKGIVRKD